MSDDDPFAVPLLSELKKHKPQKSSPLVCSCNSVYEEDIKAVYEQGDTVESIQKKTRAGTDCTNCIPQIEHVLLTIAKEEEKK